MTRVQVLLDRKELDALRRQARESGKSHSQLVREAIDAAYLSPVSDKEIARMAKEARAGVGVKRFKNSRAFLRYLWSF